MKDVFYHLFYIFISFWTKGAAANWLSLWGNQSRFFEFALFGALFMCDTTAAGIRSRSLWFKFEESLQQPHQKKKLILEFSLIITRQLSYIKYLLASAQSPFWTWRIRWCMPISFMCCTKWHIDIYLKKYLMIYEIV